MGGKTPTPGAEEGGKRRKDHARGRHDMDPPLSQLPGMPTLALGGVGDSKDREEGDTKLAGRGHNTPSDAEGRVMAGDDNGAVVAGGNLCITGRAEKEAPWGEGGIH